MQRNRVVITRSITGEILGVWGPLTPKEASVWRKYKRVNWAATVKRLQKPHWRAMQKAHTWYAKIT